MFDDQKPPVGEQLSFPFIIKVPAATELRKPSFCCRLKGVKFSILHSLFAQLEPVDSKAYSFRSEKLLSQVSTRQALKLGRRPAEVLEEQSVHPVIKELGGFLGIGKSKSTTNIILPRKQFFVGERAEV